MDEVSEVTVLHALRLAGVAETEPLSRRIGTRGEVLLPVLHSFRGAGFVRRHEGSLPGWSLTAAGRRRGEQLLAAELRRSGKRHRVEAAYGEFLDLNRGVLTACTDWQVRVDSDPMVLNDHTDREYDEEVLERLESLHARALGMLRSLVADVQRFVGYGPRLSNALATARRGEVDWVTKPVIDSYHTVWFELHEDLLATLGRRRSDESAGRNDRSPT